MITQKYDRIDRNKLNLNKNSRSSACINLFLSLSLLILNSCSQSIRIRSNPEGAEVFLVSPKNAERKSIGKTPVTIETQKVQELIHTPPSSREFLIFNIELANYDAKQMLVPVGAIGNFDTYLDVKLIPEKRKDDKSALIIQHFLNTQEFINKGDLERADLELERVFQLEKTNPWVFVMRGHIYLLKKDYKNSLLAYEKAIEMDPNNTTLLKRITDIRKFLKGAVNEKQ